MFTKQVNTTTPTTAYDDIPSFDDLSLTHVLKGELYFWMARVQLLFQTRTGAVIEIKRKGIFHRTRCDMIESHVGSIRMGAVRVGDFQVCSRGDAKSGVDRLFIPQQSMDIADDGYFSFGLDKLTRFHHCVRRVVRVYSGH